MSKFNFIKNHIDGLCVIEPTVFGDARGFFMETYNYNDFSAAGIDANFVQDNHSKSKKGVLRGLHFQTKNAQGKLVRVVKGEVFDVAVDLRRDSKTFGEWFGIFLSDINKKQFYIPAGFAHGFFVTSDEAEFLYKCTTFYDSSSESGIMWNDETLDIRWPYAESDEVLLSEKDKHHQTFKDFVKNVGGLEV